MSKQKTLFICLMASLSVFFMLLISGCQTGEKDSMASNILQQGPHVDYVDLGRDYYAKGQFKDAIAEFNKAIKINPSDVDAYYYRGCTHFAAENYKKALSDFNKAVKIDPTYVNAYINRGYYYHLKNQYPKAIADFKKALELNPNSPAAKKMLKNAITDRQLWEGQIRDNSRLNEQGITIRNDHNLPD